MYEALKNVVMKSGMWNGERKSSHAFLLSPDVYHMTVAQKENLEQLGGALSDCLLGLSHIAVISYDSDLNYAGAWRLARKVFSTGVPKYYQSLQGENVRDIPRLLKVDLMLDANGEYKIAEVDGHNKHGLGYSTLASRLREVASPHARTLPGVVCVLSEEIRRLGYSTLKLLYADQEKFYIPEFEIAAEELGKHGIACEIIPEMKAVRAMCESGLLLDLPFLYHSPGLDTVIVKAYREKSVQFIIPPKPFLGAKGVLALLRNDEDNRQLESILRAFIKSDSLDLVRKHLPETILVGREGIGVRQVMGRVEEKRYVLKESISSGMKGTVFSDGSDFESSLRQAADSRMNWILQEEIVNQPQELSWYEETEKEGVSLRRARDWFMRVTVQYVNRKLGDVVVTARRDKAVHGAKDCLQLGTIII